MNLRERMQKNLEDYNNKVRENPRYAIESKADINRNISVYFSPIGYNLYTQGKATTGSTEKFFDNDIIHKVPMDRIESITDGGTLVHINQITD